MLLDQFARFVQKSLKSFAYHVFKFCRLGHCMKAGPLICFHYFPSQCVFFAALPTDQVLNRQDAIVVEPQAPRVQVS